MEAAITARSSCARMAYTANARATTTIREINHRVYLLTLKMIHSSVPAFTFCRGRPMLKIRKRDGRVLEVWHSM